MRQQEAKIAARGGGVCCSNLKYVHIYAPVLQPASRFIAMGALKLSHFATATPPGKLLLFLLLLQPSLLLST
jgi:hypothetical protein